MKVKDLLPFNWKRVKSAKAATKIPKAPVPRAVSVFDRMLDDFERTFRDPFAFAMHANWDTKGIAPSVDVSETKGEIQIDAELPGMNDKDINVTIEKGQLILRGEKRHESREEKDKIHRMESSYGFFERVIPLPEHTKVEDAKATYKKGVLQIRIPKDLQKAQGKSIPITIG